MKIQEASWKHKRRKMGVQILRLQTDGRDEIGVEDGGIDGEMRLHTIH